MKKIKYFILLLIGVFVLSGCNADPEEEITLLKESFASIGSTIKADTVYLYDETTNGMDISWEYDENIFDGKTGKIKSSLPNGGLDSSGNPLSTTFTATIKKGKEEYQASFTKTLNDNALTEDGRAVKSVIGQINNEYQGAIYGNVFGSSTIDSYHNYRMMKESGTTKYSIKFASGEDYKEYTGISISYSNTDHLTFNSNIASLCSMAELEASFATDSNYVSDNIGYRITKGNVTVDTSFKVDLYKTNLDLNDCLNLKQVNDMFNDNTLLLKTYYNIEGTVTKFLGVVDGTQCFYLQDEIDGVSYGLYVYKADIGSSCEKVKVGDRIFIKTMLGYFGGLYETMGGDTSTPTVSSLVVIGDSVLSSYNTLTITKDNFNDSLLNKESILAKVENLIFLGDEPDKSSEGSYHKISFIFDDFNTKCYLYLDKNNENYTKFKNIIDNLVAGDIVSVPSGVIGCVSDSPRINIIDTLEKSTRKLTEEEKIKFIKATPSKNGPSSHYSSNIYNGNTWNDDDNFNKILPIKNIFDQNITWSVEVDSSLKNKIKIGSYDDRQAISLKDFGNFASFKLVSTSEAGVIKYDCYAFDEYKTIDEIIEDRLNLTDVVVVQGYVSYVGNDYAILSGINGSQVVIKGIDSSITFTKGNYVELGISSVTKETNKPYVFTVKHVIESTDNQKYVSPKAVTLNELSSEYGGYYLIENVVVTDGSFMSGTINVSVSGLSDGTYEYIAGVFMPNGENTATFTYLNSLKSFDYVNSCALNTNVSFIGVLVAPQNKDETYLYVSDRYGNVIELYAQKHVFKNSGIVVGDTVYVEGQLGSAEASTAKGNALVLVTRIVKCGNTLGFNNSSLIKTGANVTTYLADIPNTNDNKATSSATKGSRDLVTMKASITAIETTTSSLGSTTISKVQFTVKETSLTDKIVTLDLTTLPVYGYDSAVNKLFNGSNLSNNFKDLGITSNNKDNFDVTLTFVVDKTTTNSVSSYFITVVPELVVITAK